jgi:hypothetical protein
MAVFSTVAVPLMRPNTVRLSRVIRRTSTDEPSEGGRNSARSHKVSSYYSNGMGEVIRQRTASKKSKDTFLDDTVVQIKQLDRLNARIRHECKSEMRLTRALTAVTTTAVAGTTKGHRKDSYGNGGEGRRKVQESHRTVIPGRDNGKNSFMIGNSRSSVQQATQRRHQPTITKTVKAKMRRIKEGQKLRNLMRRAQKDAQKKHKAQIVLSK